MAVGAIIAGVGIVTGVGGQIFGGISARKASKKQQRMFDEQARLERELAEFQARQAERKFDDFLGDQKVAIASSGIKLEGSALDIIAETQRDKEETITNIKKAGFARASALISQANLARDQGRDAMTASIIGAFGSGAKGASSIMGAK